VANPTTHERPESAAGRGSTEPAAAGDLMAGLTDSIRNNPMTCLLVGLGLGFVVARMFKR
jgi:hypothetical protein